MTGNKRTKGRLHVDAATVQKDECVRLKHLPILMGGGRWGGDRGGEAVDQR